MIRFRSTMLSQRMTHSSSLVLVVAIDSIGCFDFFSRCGSIFVHDSVFLGGSLIFIGTLPRIGSLLRCDLSGETIHSRPLGLSTSKAHSLPLALFTSAIHSRSMRLLQSEVHFYPSKLSGFSAHSSISVLSMSMIHSGDSELSTWEIRFPGLVQFRWGWLTQEQRCRQGEWLSQSQEDVLPRQSRPRAVQERAHH